MSEKPTITVTVRDASETVIIGPEVPPEDTPKTAGKAAAKKEEE